MESARARLWMDTNARRNSLGRGDSRRWDNIPPLVERDLVSQTHGGRMHAKGACLLLLLLITDKT